jgi:hypothetical protein
MSDDNDAITAYGLLRQAAEIESVMRMTLKRSGPVPTADSRHVGGYDADPAELVVVPDVGPSGRRRRLTNQVLS